MDNPNNKKSKSQFPLDLFVLLSPTVIGLPILELFDYLPRTPSHARSTLLIVAIVLAAIGIGLLVAARLPLYRERCFFTMNFRALDSTHRALHHWAGIFLVASALLFAIVWSRF